MVWGWPMIGLLMGTHVYMTVRTGGIQRQVLRGIRLSVTRDSAAQGDVSQFGALVTSLCSTIGTGNILGVGTAIALGGPGAVLWMWLTGIFGMATKYAETLLAVRYRVRTGSGSMLGGAMYVLERGLRMRRMGIAFGVLGAVCAFGTGCTVQAGAAASGLRALVPLPLPAAGLILCALTGLCILRGIRSIARVAEKLVPATFTTEYPPGEPSWPICGLPGGGRRNRRKRRCSSLPVWGGPGALFQRVRHGISASGRRLRQNGKSQAAGPGFYDRDLLGHWGDLSDDGPGVGE